MEEKGTTNEKKERSPKLQSRMLQITLGFIGWEIAHCLGNIE